MRPFIASALLLATECFSVRVLADDSAATLYQANCAACHGAQLQGAQGPALMQNNDPRLDDESALASIVRDGLPEKGMPAWSGRLSDTEISSLAQFIKRQRDETSAQQLRLADKESLRSLPRGRIHSDLQSFSVEPIAEPDKPTGLAVLPDGRLLITQEKGGLRIVEGSHLAAEPIEGAPSGRPKDVFKRVLLGVALHPDYAHNGWIYLTCGDTVTDDAGKLITEVILYRGRLHAHAWVDSEILVRVPTNSSVVGPIAFDGQGHVFLTTASAAGLGTGPESKIPGREPLSVTTLMATPPQDPTSPNGKILRFNDDGTIPTDNPFIGSPKAYGAVWSLGIRNSAALAFDSTSNQLWATDHGPRGGDKINLILKGHNYGWPVISYGTRYDGVAFTTLTERAGMDQPIVSWTPDIGVSALAIYRGKAFPRWNGNLLVGSLVTQQLLRIVLSNDAVTLQETLLPHLGRIRALTTGVKGEIYAALELAQQGAVVRLVP